MWRGRSTAKLHKQKSNNMFEVIEVDMSKLEGFGNEKKTALLNEGIDRDIQKAEIAKGRLDLRRPTKEQLSKVLAPISSISSNCYLLMIENGPGSEEYHNAIKILQSALDNAERIHQEELNRRVAK